MNSIPDWVIELMPPNTRCEVRCQNGQWYLNGRHVTKSEKVVKLVNGQWQTVKRSN